MRQFGRHLLFGAEILLLSGLILVTRCANYRDVFIGGHIYFTDADCYARMTRVRLCAEHPGLVVRHHSFENFPEGTTPHTTAVLDYAILLLSVALRPFSSRPIDFAAAFISPLIALLTGIFLCWWARRLSLPFRWAMLVLFILSPILVHGTELGRPDHQSLVTCLVMVAVAAGWSMHRNPGGTGWNIVRGVTWAVALWVSAYEPLILFILTVATGILISWTGAQEAVEPGGSGRRRNLTTVLAEQFFGPAARKGWIAFAGIILLAALVERRLPILPQTNDALFQNWSRTIGELAPVHLVNRIWFRWMGWLILATPILLLVATVRGQIRSRPTRPNIVILFGVTFGLTIWQARWGYFTAALFVMLIPDILTMVRWRVVAWSLFVCSLWPVLRDWDEKLWPDEVLAAHQFEQRHEMVELRELSVSLISTESGGFLAPWWLSPAIAYWSGQPGVAGSSHESLPGIVDSARFYLADNPAAAAEVLRRRQVAWVISYDAERVEENSAMILGKAASNRCLARVLDQRPSYAPPFLKLISQNGTGKIFEVTKNW